MKFDTLLSLLTLLIFAKVSSVVTAFSKPVSENQAAPAECSFPRLKTRLIDMINANEPEAFEIILHSECRYYLQTSHLNYMEVFEHLLNVSELMDVSKFLRIMTKGAAYTPLMLITWARHRPLVSLPVLRLLKLHLKCQESSLIYTLSREYPQNSPERVFMSRWLVSLQKTLNWPFSPSNSPSKSAAGSQTPRSPIKSKSFFRSQLKKVSWSDFEGIPGFNLPEENESKTDDEIMKTDVVIDNFADEFKETDTTVTLPDSDNSINVPLTDIPVSISSSSSSTQEILDFGHIYGWVSRHNNPIVRNSPDLFHLCGHYIKLQDNFLGFSSPKFKLEKYADSAKNPSQSFFDKPNSALAMKVRQSGTGRNFSACRLQGNQLQVMLKGNLILVVLGQSPDGNYDFKYPPNPYCDLSVPRDSNTFESFSIQVNPADIVLLLPRTLFTDPELKISCYDIMGTFLYAELSSFPENFVNFVNFIHSKTLQHTGLIAIGGFIHIREQQTSPTK